MPVAHEAWIVALSILVAIQGCYVALGLTLRVSSAVGNARRLTLAAAALTFAVSIWSKHFVGMLAVRLPFEIDYLVLPALLSFLASVFVAGAAVFVASHARQSRWAVPGAALIMGAGIATMHYIGMLALHGSAMLHHDPWLVAASFLIAVSAVFLLTLVPDAAPRGATIASLAVQPEFDPVAPSSTVAPQKMVAQVLPVERDGATHYMPTAMIVLVQADTHYTMVSDGHVRCFCPLSIGEVEQRLDPSRFLRVHRSFIVAVPRIVSLKRQGDGGVAMLDTPDGASVPVSRGRYAAVKARMAGR